MSEPFPRFRREFVGFIRCADLVIVWHFADVLQHLTIVVASLRRLRSLLLHPL
jgi:hypothetical protein